MRPHVTRRSIGLRENFPATGLVSVFDIAIEDACPHGNKAKPYADLGDAARQINLDQFGFEKDVPMRLLEWR